MKKTLIFCMVLCLLLAVPFAAHAQAPEITPTAAPLENHINIGVAYPTVSIDQDTLFIKGLTLALEKINAGGGVLGKPINLVIRDDQNDITEALQIAQTFCDSKIQAVIGHWSSNVSYVVKETYESRGVVMITPSATSMSLFDAPSHFIYRMIPNNDAYSKAMAQDIAGAGLKNIAVYYSDDVYGRAFANRVEHELSLLGVHVIDRITNISSANAEQISDRWKAFGCDGVVIAAVLPDAADAISLIQSMHPDHPLFGAENFDRQMLLDSADVSTSNLYMACYDLSTLDADFLKLFRETYGRDPGAFAITGYQSLMLLKDAIEAVGDYDGAKIADYLSALKDYPAITGKLTLNPDTREFEGYKLRIRAVGSGTGSTGSTSDVK